MKKEPIILAIETAVGNGSLSILKGCDEIAHRIGDEKASRSEDLLQMISEILENNYLRIRDIDLIAVSVGPGSFTGVRVGLAVAKALVYGLNCAGIGVSVTQALAFAMQTSGEAIVIVTPSGRSQIFWQVFISDGLYEKQFLPQVGNFKDLITDLEFNGFKNIPIVIESKLYKELQITLNEINKEITVVCASDNLSKLVGQAGLYLTNNHAETHKPSFSELLPEYVLDFGAKV
jgi:tRNA threonylcarbamoyladenosine biosynthesis protein TsaB